jgi:mannose-6-phosphate isomerase-like protein (cupin superfamily)
MRKDPEMPVERFEVIEGTMTFKLGRKTIVAKAGDVVTLPAGKAHKLANGGFIPAQAVIRLQPGNDSHRE